MEKADNIGQISYVVAQLYEHSHRRQFKITHQAYAALGTVRFGHLPSNCFLAAIPSSDRVAESRTHVEVSTASGKIYEELLQDKSALAKAVISLNTIRRKGKASVSVLSIIEDDGVA